METFAAFKPNLIATKSPNLISSNMNATYLPMSTNAAAAAASMSKNEKFKASYDYLISKSQSDNQLQLHHQISAQHHHHHHHHNQQQQQMSMQIKNETISPASYLKACQASANESLSVNSANNGAGTSSLANSLPSLLPKPTAWSSHLYSFQSADNMNAASNCLAKNSASNSQQISYNHQYL